MKYLYTLAFITLSFVGFSQSYGWENINDTILIGDTGDDIDFHSQLQNTTGANMTIRWRITSFSPTSTNWDAYMCEELICWPSWTEVPTNDVTVMANDSFELFTHVQMLSDSGSGYITLCTHNVVDSASTYSCRTYFAMTDTVPDTTTSVGFIADEPTKLAQNAPNPFKESTMIRYEMASENGLIRIHDLTGKMVKEVTLVSRTGQVTVGNELRSGVYFYSLWDNGQMVDTKRMQVIK